MTDRPAIPAPGDIWWYPYLWAREDERGETEGRKMRPVAVAFLIRRNDGKDHVLLLAITTKQPRTGQPALEVPEIEKHRAELDHELDHELRQWIILDERNEDMPADSYYMEPDGFIGRFSHSFTKKIQAAKIAAIKARKSRGVKRRDD